MDASPEVLHELLLALREQVKARIGDPNSLTSADDASVKQFNTLAQAAEGKTPVPIPRLVNGSSTRYTEVLDSISFALSVMGTAISGEAIVLESNDILPVSDQHDAVVEKVEPLPPKPTVFIGCSTEGTQYAKIIQLQLEGSVHCAIWNQGVFGLSMGTLETLVAETNRFDFAILVLTPDDLRLKRDELGRVPRDNVVFELGLFMGALGRESVFVVAKKGADLPSDLAGITAAIFDGEGVNAVAALGPTCTRLAIAMGVLG
jgi:predicted nucleotide-binding protein